jgi:pyruvate/2-oxoglutarate dehydrogenase complex dihydrolipoamide acyltransferase (E2) component
MRSNIIMPQLGETVAEGKILTWFKAVGDEVKPGDRLFEVETDKVTIDVEATSEGILSEILVNDGDVAKIGSVVAINGGKMNSPPPQERVLLTSAASTSSGHSPFEEVATPIRQFGRASGPNGVRLSPLARRLVHTHQLDIAKIAESVLVRGRKRILEADVRAALETGTAETAHSPMPVTDKILLNRIRRKTADRLTENWRTIPHVFQAIEIDFSKVETARENYKGKFHAATGIALTYLPFVARATCIALRDFPKVNARFSGEALDLSREVNLGVAVDLSHEGLAVPVVRNADELTIAGLTKAIGRKIEKARTGKLNADDFADGTYTITNNGAFGTLFTSPIINAPQVAILSMDAIRKRPAVVQTPEGDFIAVRLMGVIGQSFDHRAFDGAYSAAFLARLKKLIEERGWIEELESGF